MVVVTLRYISSFCFLCRRVIIFSVYMKHPSIVIPSLAPPFFAILFQGLRLPRSLTTAVLACLKPSARALSSTGLRILITTVLVGIIALRLCSSSRSFTNKFSRLATSFPHDDGHHLLLLMSRIDHLHPSSWHFTVPFVNTMRPGAMFIDDLDEALRL